MYIKIKYKYDSCGNICRITENGHVVAKYEYDSLNRLIREDNKPLNKTVLYSYDQNGNITERCEYAYTLKSGEELEELKCTHYSYDYEGDKLVSYNGETFEYNNLGCPTTYCGKTCGWQYGKMLASYNGTLFEYDGLGRRTSKSGITFTYDSDGRLIKQSNGLEFIYDNSGVVGVKYGGVQYFYRKDAQGNIIAILDSNGKVVVKYEYDAWGKHKVVDANGIGVLNPFRYRGYYYDTETGLYYLQTRYYDPELGRFISQDSLEYADPETINGLNLYAYCGNNPVMSVDPSGNAWWNWLIIGIQAVAGIVACFVPGGQGLGVSLLVGATLGAVSQVVAPAVAQVIGGATSISNGIGAFSTGISLLGAGPIGIIVGVGLMAVGAATALFGANEMVAGITGTNYIQKWTGMSDYAYGWTYAGLNIASSLGQLVGNRYLQYKSREVKFNSDGSPRQYRYYDRSGNRLYDVDFGHGNINWKHYHAWLNNTNRLGENHTGYLIMILGLFRRLFW